MRRSLIAPAPARFRLSRPQNKKSGSEGSTPRVEMIMSNFNVDAKLALCKSKIHSFVIGLQNSPSCIIAMHTRRWRLRPDAISQFFQLNVCAADKNTQSLTIDWFVGA